MVLVFASVVISFSPPKGTGSDFITLGGDGIRCYLFDIVSPHFLQVMSAQLI